MVNREDLIELRELFRKRFHEADFCIGEEQVEKVFRELLGEPEPVPPPFNPNSPVSKIKAEDVARIMQDIIKPENIFERDNTFYRRFMK